MPVLCGNETDDDWGAESGDEEANPDVSDDTENDSQEFSADETCGVMGWLRLGGVRARRRG